MHKHTPKNIMCSQHMSSSAQNVTLVWNYILNRVPNLSWGVLKVFWGSGYIWDYSDGSVQLKKTLFAILLAVSTGVSVWPVKASKYQFFEPNMVVGTNVFTHYRT